MCMGVYLFIMMVAFIFVRISIHDVFKPEIYDLPDYVFSIQWFLMAPTIPWLGIFTEVFKFPYISPSWLFIIAHFLNGLLLFVLGSGVAYEVTMIHSLFSNWRKRRRNK